MNCRYNTAAQRRELRETLLQATHKKRLFDFAGNAVRELDLYRATILCLLDELDEANALLHSVQTSSERELSSLQKDNSRLQVSIANYKESLSPKSSVSTTANLNSLPLTRRVRRLLCDAGFDTVQDLFAFNLHDFIRIHGFGANALISVNQALCSRGLAPLSESTPATPYLDNEERLLYDIDEPVEVLKLHPYVERRLKAMGKCTVRSILLTTLNEECKIFYPRSQALRYLWQALSKISFPERAVPDRVASEYAHNELFFRSPHYLYLSTYTLNVLTVNDILTIGELLAHSRESLRALTGFTFATIDPIQKKLKHYGFRLRRKGKELTAPTVNSVLDEEDFSQANASH